LNNRTLEEALLKSLTTAAGQIGDFIPPDMADEFIAYIRDLSFCRQLFRTWPMASKTRDIPKILSGMSVWYESSEIVEAKPTDFATGTITLTAKKFLAQVMASMEIYEDSKFSVDSIIVDDFANAVAEAEELAMLVGDPDHTATASTPDSATEGNWYTKDPRLIFEGLLFLAQSSSAAAPVNASGSAFTEAMIANTLYRLGKYGRNFKNTVLFVDPFNALQLMQRDTFKTLDKYGPGATIFTGEIGKLWGQITTISAPFLTEGNGIVTHKGNPIIGDRRLIKIKDEEVIASDAKRTVVSERFDFTVEYVDAICWLRNLPTANIAS